MILFYFLYSAKIKPLSLNFQSSLKKKEIFDSKKVNEEINVDRIIEEKDNYNIKNNKDDNILNERNDFEIIYDNDVISIKDKNGKIIEKKRNCEACFLAKEFCLIF